jgi:ribosomal protein S18 acetylase RimI-like enzyme
MDVMARPPQHRPVVAADAPLLAALHTASWRDAYRGILTDAYLADAIEADRQALWQERLAAPDPAAFGWIAHRDGVPIGFVYAIGDAEPPWGTLVDNLHVLPAHRGGGTGRALLASVARAMDRRALAPALHLWVYAANDPARAFYARLGGAEVEEDLDDAPDGQRLPIVRVAWRGAALRALATA